MIVGRWLPRQHGGTELLPGKWVDGSEASRVADSLLDAASELGATGSVACIHVRPQLERDDPLNLSISISGGKETNQDSLSNGERSGNSSGCQSPAERSANCGLETPAVLARFPGPKLTWNGAS